MEVLPGRAGGGTGFQPNHIDSREVCVDSVGEGTSDAGKPENLHAVHDNIRSDFELQIVPGSARDRGAGAKQKSH